MCKIIVVIPARYGSTRLPGKPLADLGGKPVIQHTYERVATAHGLSEVIVATDDLRDIVVNVQGDEPFIDTGMLDEVIAPLVADPELVMSTLSREITEDSILKVPSVVKVVSDIQGNALYFSRSVIPYGRHPQFCHWQEHIGLYAYRKDFLLDFVHWPPTPLEQAESLEQLRVLEHGYRIRVVETTRGQGVPGIDTPEDLARANRYLANLR